MHYIPNYVLEEIGGSMTAEVRWVSGIYSYAFED